MARWLPHSGFPILVGFRPANSLIDLEILPSVDGSPRDSRESLRGLLRWQAGAVHRSGYELVGRPASARWLPKRLPANRRIRDSVYVTAHRGKSTKRHFLYTKAKASLLRQGASIRRCHTTRPRREAMGMAWPAMFLDELAVPGGRLSQEPGLARSRGHMNLLGAERRRHRARTGAWGRRRKHQTTMNGRKYSARRSCGLRMCSRRIGAGTHLRIEAFGSPSLGMGGHRPVGFASYGI